MKIIKDKKVSNSVRYTKIEHKSKVFKRFQYFWKGKSMDIQWLCDDAMYPNESLEVSLEREFKKIEV